MLVQIEDIIIRKRVRQDLGDLTPLMDSLKRYGLMNPITINTKNELIAGHRRLEAAKLLGWNSITAVVINPQDETQALEMELEENVQRSAFSDEELMQGYARLEKLRNPGFFKRLWLKIIAFLKKLFGID